MSYLLLTAYQDENMITVEKLNTIPMAVQLDVCQDYPRWSKNNSSVATSVRWPHRYHVGAPFAHPEQHLHHQLVIQRNRVMLSHADVIIISRVEKVWETSRGNFEP